MRRAVFLDRDGVINKAIIKDGKAHSPRTLSEFELIKDIAEEIARIKKAGYLVIVVTNQPDIDRGTIKQSEVDKMSEVIRANLDVDEILVCPHDDEDDCGCRKPRPGLILRTVDKYKIDLKKSFVVGDGWKDMGAARAAGCRGILIQAIYNQGVDCFKRVTNFHEAVNAILKEKEEEGCCF